MKLLLIGDQAHTGFGRVGREVGRRLLDKGVDIRVIAINWRGRDGEMLAAIQSGASTEEVIARLRELDEDPLTPKMVPAYRNGDGMGLNLTAPAVSGRLWPNWKPDRVLVVADPRAMLHRLATDQGALATLPVYNYVPIEGGDLPPSLRSMWNIVRPVAMTMFGAAEIERLVGQPVPVINHGVSDAFRPLSVADPGTWKGRTVTSKDTAKAAIGLSGRRVLLRTDRLVPRKDMMGLLSALGPVLEANRDVTLVLHCAPSDEGGLLSEMISHLPGAFDMGGSWSHPQVKVTGAHDTYRGLSDEELRTLYNAADVYVSTTMSEGWGLCGAEAAACGVPVVTTDYAAQPEIVGPGALLAKVRGLVWNQYASRWALVDEDDFAEKVTYLLEHPAKARAMGEAGRRHVTRWSWDRTADDFLSLLDPGSAAKAA